MESLNKDKVLELQNDKKRILIEFTATWCSGCRSLIPRLEKLEKEYPKIHFVKVDVDQNEDYIKELGITGIPSVFIYSGTHLITRLIGVKEDSTYKEILNEL